MSPPTHRFARSRRRAFAVVTLTALVAALGAFAGTPAAASPARHATTATTTATTVTTTTTATGLPYRLTNTPLLLVHGYSDDCTTAFDTLDKTDAGVDATTPLRYFQDHGFNNVQTVGYYSGSWNATYSDGSTPNVSDDGCTLNVQDQNAGQDHCGGVRPFYYTSDPIEHLACLMAWYLYGRPVPVDIIAHSMGGLVVRGAMYFSTHHPSDGYGYTFPPGALPVGRVVTVATPHDGLQGALAQVYQSSQPSQEVADMTVCHNYAASCTVSTALDIKFGAQALKTSDFMYSMRVAGRPAGSVDTYWALMGSSVLCNLVRAGTLGSCAARASAGDDPFTSSDFVVQADSQMAMAADAKIFYGDLEIANSDGSYSDYNSGAQPYGHEANTCMFTYAVYFGVAHACAGSPYYLNDGRTGTTKAWVCTTGCIGGIGGGILDLNYTGGAASAVAVPYSLAEMAHLLLAPTRAQIGHAAHAGNDYPYGGMGLYNQHEGVDPWTQYYGQCDSFASWKVYENLGGTGHPSAASLPAVGWRPSDAWISPVVGYAGLSSKAGTWGDAHDWIRSDQGLHAAPWFGVPFDGIPQPGAIAVWPTSAEDPNHGMPNQYGHVAYVTDVVDANTIRIENYNMFGIGEWSTVQVTRSGGGTAVGFGRNSFWFPWPGSFVHLGDGTAGPVAPMAVSGNAYAAGTYGPTGNSGGPSFTLAGAAYPNTVDGWYVSRGHGVIGWQLYSNTHNGLADSTATWNPPLPVPNGCYRVDAFVPDTWSNSSFALYTVSDQHFGTSVVPVDENAFTNQFANLGTFQADGSGRLRVQLTDQGPGPPQAYHQVGADGMRYVPTSCGALSRSALVVDAATPGFTTTDVWYAQAGHGLRGNERWTYTNGVAAVSTATYTPVLPAGCYRVDAFVPDYASNSPAALYTITDGAFGTPTLADIDESATTNDFVNLGVFQTRGDGTMTVTITDQNPTGLFVAADAVKFTPAPCSTVRRASVVIDPATGSPDFTTAGATFGNGDIHGWYHTPGGGLRGNQWWTYAAGLDPSSTATYSPSGMTPAGGCVAVRAFIPNNHANNPHAGYSVSVTGPVSGYGMAFTVDQSTPTNAWVDLGRYQVPANGHLSVTVNDTATSALGTLYTSADAIDFRSVTGC